MAMVSGTNIAASKHQKLREAGKIRRVFDSFGKYAVDFAANFSSKADSGPSYAGSRGRLHKTVQEEIKDQTAVKPCNNSIQNPVAISREKKMQTNMEEMEEEMNSLKHKTSASSENMKPLSSNNLPPKQLKEKEFLLPNKKRIMIRSRL